MVSNIPSESSKDLTLGVAYLRGLSPPQRVLVPSICTLASLILVMPATNAVSYGGPGGRASLQWRSRVTPVAVPPLTPVAVPPHSSGCHVSVPVADLALCKRGV